MPRRKKLVVDDIGKEGIGINYGGANGGEIGVSNKVDLVDNEPVKILTVGAGEVPISTKEEETIKPKCTRKHKVIARKILELDRSTLLVEKERLLILKKNLEDQLIHLDKQLKMDIADLVVKYIDVLLDFVPEHMEDCNNDLESGCQRCILLETKRTGKWDKDTYDLSLRIRRKGINKLTNQTNEGAPVVSPRGPVKLGLPASLQEKLRNREGYSPSKNRVHEPIHIDDEEV